MNGAALVNVIQDKRKRPCLLNYEMAFVGVIVRIGCEQLGRTQLRPIKCPLEYNNVDCLASSSVVIVNKSDYVFTIKDIKAQIIWLFFSVQIRIKAVKNMKSHNKYK